MIDLYLRWKSNDSTDEGRAGRWSRTFFGRNGVILFEILALLRRRSPNGAIALVWRRDSDTVGRTTDIDT